MLSMAEIDLEIITLRRYLTFERFLQTLQDGLYIPNASLFDDHWEAMLYHMDGYLKERGTALLLKDEKIPTLDDFYIPDIYRSIREGLKEVYVSCWNGTVHECVAMWELYGKNQNAVMIETNASELTAIIESFSASRTNEWFICLKDLKYVLPGKDQIPDSSDPIWINQVNSVQQTFRFHQVFTGLQYKHKSYEFEKEYRLIIARTQRGQLAEKGLKIPLDKQTFIKKVILQPKSSDGFKKVISNSLNEYGFENVAVERSIIDELPLYED
jgi:hypothetical protein